MKKTVRPYYICYDDRLFSGFLPNKTLLYLYNSTCHKPDDFPVIFDHINNTYEQIHRCNTICSKDSTACDSSIMYKCYYSLKYENDDDITKRRIWCIVTYLSRVQIYDRAISLIHFFVPFVLNLALTMTSRQRIKTQYDSTYGKTLHAQIRIHKYLVIASIVLGIIPMPRLILSFISDCMKSTGDV
ncbi:hypothetical protein I4U23_004187 [Adineta vaga]|nr:hypothetical protein I4U23_004187 [Adineta vaga]